MHFYHSFHQLLFTLKNVATRNVKVTQVAQSEYHKIFLWDSAAPGPGVATPSVSITATWSHRLVAKTPNLGDQRPPRLSQGWRRAHIPLLLFVSESWCVFFHF